MNKRLQKLKNENPSYYQGRTMSVGDVIEDFDLNFWLGSSVKYILRAGKKSDKDIEDLEKARACILKEIEYRSNLTNCTATSPLSVEDDILSCDEIGLIDPDDVPDHILDVSGFPIIVYHYAEFDLREILGDAWGEDFSELDMGMTRSYMDIYCKVGDEQYSDVLLKLYGFSDCHYVGFESTYDEVVDCTVLTSAVRDPEMPSTSDDIIWPPLNGEGDAK